MENGIDIRKGRDKANEFVNAYISNHKAGYDEFVHKIENFTIGDLSVMQDIFKLAISYTPDWLKVMFEGKEDDVDCPFEDFIEQCVHEDATLGISICDGVEIVADGRSKQYAAVISMDSYEKLKAQILLSMRFFFPFGSSDEDILDDECFKYIYVCAFCAIPEILENMKRDAIQTQNPLLLYSYYYAALDHGFLSFSKRLPGILLSSGIGFLSDYVTKSLTTQFVQTTIAYGHEDKTTWKNLAESTDNDNLFSVITSVLRRIKGNRGQKKAPKSLNDLLVGKIDSARNLIEVFIQENPGTAYLASLLIALQKAHCIKCNKYITFHRAMANEFSIQGGERYPKDIYNEYVKNNRKFLSSPPMWKDIQELVGKWTEKFQAAQS